MDSELIGKVGTIAVIGLLMVGLGSYVRSVVNRERAGVASQSATVGRADAEPAKEAAMPSTEPARVNYSNAAVVDCAFDYLHDHYEAVPSLAVNPLRMEDVQADLLGYVWSMRERFVNSDGYLPKAKALDLCAAVGSQEFLIIYGNAMGHPPPS